MKFPRQEEIQARFRAVMDSLDDSLGDDIPHLIFRKRSLFYSLFACGYDTIFVQAMPKSIMRAFPALSIMIFEDLKSLWTMPIR